MNHEAWAIPYADLMTLLLAFFVVMYAVSVVNEGKYRVLSDSLVQAFNGSSHVVAPMPATPTRPRNIVPAIVTPSGAPSSATPAAIPIPARTPPKPAADDHPRAPAGAAPGSMQQIESRVRDALQPLIDKQLVNVRRDKNNQWLEIEIRTDLLFPSGVATLDTPAQGVLRNLAAVLVNLPNQMRVEGFTDDVPISTAQYPSNWELSAARAGSVARLFVASGIAPARLGIVGWGETRPVADNTTDAGRQRNRRVLVVVLGADSALAREQGGIDDPRLQPAATGSSAPVTLPGPPVVAPPPQGAATPTATGVSSAASAPAAAPARHER